MKRTLFFTLGDIGLRYGVPTWQVRRLFERGLLPPAARAGLYRVVGLDDLPAVENALRVAGYLRTESKAVCAS